MSLELDRLFEAKDFVTFLFDHMPSAVFLVGPDIRIQKVNQPFQALFSRPEREALNQLCGNALGCYFAHDEGKPCGQTRHCGQCSLRACIGRGFQDTEALQTTTLSRTFFIGGQALQKHFRIKAQQVSFQGESLVIVMVDDITDLEAEKARIEEMANRDYLTQLHNRRYFFDVAEKIFENALRDHMTLAVVMMDIDHFKSINDRYGHDVGDRVLQHVSQILAENTRKSDVLARFGGEEFCLLLTQVNPETALSVTEKLRSLVAESVLEVGGEEVDVTISCGVSSSMEDALDKMIHRADAMLYRSKQNGRNRTTLSS